MAFPPGLPRAEAEKEILRLGASPNDDGVGVAFVKDGAIQIRKYGLPAKNAIEQGKTLLEHMPHDGWTVAHVRQATHGSVCDLNSHPFLVGDAAYAHNGVWSNYDGYAALLKAFGLKATSDTDSEVLALVMSKVGPADLARYFSHAGVVMQLRSNGDLWIAKCSGRLEIKELENKTYYIATEIQGQSSYMRDGWARFLADGTLDLENYYYTDSWTDKAEKAEVPVIHLPTTPSTPTQPDRITTYPTPPPRFTNPNKRRWTGKTIFFDETGEECSDPIESVTMESSSLWDKESYD
jgi:predicted glutamine amidotransferase